MGLRAWRLAVFFCQSPAPAALVSQCFRVSVCGGTIARLYPERLRPQSHLENYLEAFAATARYVRYTPGIKVILTRDFLFGFFIAVVPALLPVVALQHLRLQANQLGLVFTSLGVGSLLGGTLVLPYARDRKS